MEFDSIVKKLRSYGGVRITEKELRTVISNQEYEKYFCIVMQLIEYGILLPVKSSGANGMRPPLYKRYTILKAQADYKEFLQQIRLLHSKLNVEGYLTNPERFLHHEAWLIPLDNFLKNNIKSLEAPASINERSFQIFRQEKALKENKELSLVLNFNHGLREALNYYYTPEPFFMHYITQWEVGGVNVLNTGRLRQLNILIIENKDTWYTLKSILKVRHNNLSGIAFDALLYGEGKKISRKNDSLSDFDKNFFGGSRTSYFYFGDLDFEGISIFRDLVNTNPGLEIQLMKELYIKMFESANGIELPITKENQNQKALKWFLSSFNEDQQNKILSILQAGKYVPQEILNYSDFLKEIIV